MIFDTHLHESKYSLDSEISLIEIVLKAREIGLDGICITDHESNEICEEAEVLSRRLNYPIIVGAEILTYQGDMTVFGLRKLPKKMMHAQQLSQLVEQHGGVAICSHPFRQNDRGMGNHISQLNPIWGVEAFNGSTPYHHNMTAYNLAQKLSLPSLGGSDAHVIEQVGKFATLFPKWVKKEADLIKAIKQKNCSPVFYYNGKYRKIAEYHDVYRDFEMVV